MILEELRRFLCAVQFLTRVPVPNLEPWRPDRLTRSARYFPLVGLMVGLACAAVLWAAKSLWLGGPMPALLAVAVGVLLTGAFHEDGLADTADGLRGGQTPERRLEIMKDSRLGTYGALTLGLALAVKVLALGMLHPTTGAVAVLVCAHAGGRAAAVAAMVLTPYAGVAAAAKMKPEARGVRPWEAVVALGFAVAPLLWLSPVAAAVCVAVGALFALWPALAARRLIGGHTGDVLGAVEQAFETGFILAAAGLWALEFPLT
jgi:adenosylcobinamide-GDP ribazoletransferase